MLLLKMIHFRIRFHHQQQQQDLRGTIQFWRDLKIWKLIGGNYFFVIMCYISYFWFTALTTEVILISYFSTFHFYFSTFYFYFSTLYILIFPTPKFNETD